MILFLSFLLNLLVIILRLEIILLSKHGLLNYVFLNAFYKTLINKMVHCPAVSCTISLYAYNCVMFKSRSSQPYPCPQRLICLRWKYLNLLFQLSFVRKASVALRVAVVMSMCERWDFTFLHKDNLVPLLNHSPPPPPHVLSRF